MIRKKATYKVFVSFMSLWFKLIFKIKDVTLPLTLKLIFKIKDVTLPLTLTRILGQYKKLTKRKPYV